MSHRLINTYYYILSQILTRYSTNPKRDKLRLHNSFKAYYRLTFGKEQESLRDYSRDELIELINMVLVEFAVEYGIYLQTPNEPDNAEELSLAGYLEHMRWVMESKIFDQLDSIEELPKGYSLIYRIERITKRKDPKKPIGLDNLAFTTTRVYIHSYRTNRYHPKALNENTPINKVIEYIRKRILYGSI